MMASSGGDIGFQLGAEATDVVVLVLNDDGAVADEEQQNRLQAPRRAQLYTFRHRLMRASNLKPYSRAAG